MPFLWHTQFSEHLYDLMWILILLMRNWYVWVSYYSILCIKSIQTESHSDIRVWKWYRYLLLRYGNHYSRRFTSRKSYLKHAVKRLIQYIKNTYYIVIQYVCTSSISIAILPFFIRQFRFIQFVIYS